MADNANIQNDENWSAAGVVGMFDSALLSRARRKHRMLSCCWCLIVGVVLGIPLFLTWQKLEDSRRLTLIEEFGSRRSALQDLPNDKNPAVVAQLEKADHLRQQATTGSVGESVTTLREALNRLRDAAAIDQKLEQIRPLLNPLGETLSPAATPEDGSPWLLSSAVIAQRLGELQKRHAQIVTHLELGETAKAEQMLAELLRDVGQLQRDNVSAMHTETARRNWLRLQAKIPERLQTHAAWPAISRAGKDAEAGWDSGDWANSRLLYSGAAEDLERFLNAESTPTEKAELLQTDAEAVVRLETEKADLMQQIRSLRDEKIKLGEQLSATNEQRLTAEGTVAALAKERERLQTAEATATAELTKLRPLKDQLAAKDSEINALKTASSNGDENSVIVQVKATGKVPTAANLQMVPIAAGTFMMGNGSSAKETTIAKPFYAGKYEVTIGQILTWLNSSGVVFKDEWIDLSDSDCPVRKSGSKFELNTSTKFGTSQDQPMTDISWIGAKAFCEWCSQQDSRFTYRLPTEAEWEYLARAGSTTAYPWGDSCNGTEANIDGTNPHGTSSKGPYLQKTTTVGSYKPNAWGIFDTVGNTWEWCEDNYDGSGSSRVLRGGSWHFYAIHACSSYRYLYSPVYRYRSIGFRVVAE